MSVVKPSPQSIAESERSTDQCSPKEVGKKAGWVEKSQAGKVGLEDDDAKFRLIESNRKVAKTIVRIGDVEVLFPFQDPYPC